MGAALVGRKLTRIEYRVPRLAERAETLQGRRITAVTSHGKAMLIRFSNGLTHFSHNQLYGSWRVTTHGRLQRLIERRARSIRVILATADEAAVLLSATRIELLTRAELARQPYLAALGPDVLDGTTTLATVKARLRDPAFARRSLAALLLDQRFLAGLGNYLRSDILHASRLRHTARPADLDAASRDRLARAILALPRLSLQSGGATNTPAVVRTLTAQGVGRGARRFRVYAREGLPCWTCGTTIRRTDVSGRAIFWCPACQPA